ncbi:alcohol dehydrogenase catalytic domain-containing protein [Cobetia marina]
MSRALMLHDETPRARVVELSDDQLPDLPVTVAIERSGLNYKDALAITGRGKIVRELPFVPGIDFAGRVEASDSPDFQPGDEVILTGWAWASVIGADWPSACASSPSGWSSAPRT